MYLVLDEKQLNAHAKIEIFFSIGSQWQLCGYRVMVQNQVWRRRKSLHLVSTKKNLPSDFF